MTREENLHWLNVEIWTWENECQSKHPVKEALYAARKALEQEPILEKDGTLIVTTEHCKNVGRVLVQYGTNGTLFYQDQEPSKPMVEIDLYSVVKQKYIEREVLDKISAEIYNAIEFERKWLCDAGHTSKDIDIALNAIKCKVKDVLEKGAED